MERIAILAGGGRLPLAIADSIAARGGVPSIVAIKGTAAGEVTGSRHAVSEVELGALAAMLKALRAGGDTVVVAGSLTRPNLMKLRFDHGVLRYLPDVLSFLSGGDDAVLTRVVRFFEARGLKVVGVEAVAPELVARAGLIAGTDEDGAADDIARGFAILGEISPLDIGQALVVRNGQLAAVEGIEGTDQMLARLGHEGRDPVARPSGVLVKAPKRGQELRIDLPAIGPETISRAGEAGLAGIVVEAGRSLVIDRAEVMERANRYGVWVRGVTAPAVAAAGIGNGYVAPGAGRGGQHAALAGGGRVLGRVVPNEYDRADILRAIEACRTLQAFKAGAAAAVVRSHVLGVTASEGPLDLATRFSQLQARAGGGQRRRRGAFVIEARSYRHEPAHGDAGTADLEAVVRQLSSTSIGGVAVVRRRRDAIELDEHAWREAIVAADAAGLYLIDLVADPMGDGDTGGVAP